MSSLGYAGVINVDIQQPRHPVSVAGIVVDDHGRALLERRGVRATFFVPGRVAGQHPGRVEAIVKARHELAQHGYTHTSPSRLSRDQEEAELTRGLEVLRSFSSEITGHEDVWVATTAEIAGRV